MCWSPHATLGFVIGECLASAVLCTRGEAMSRFVVFIQPLILQEAVQLWLWFVIEAEEASCYASATCATATCSERNSLLSCAEMVIIMLLPSYWCMRASRALDRSIAAVDAVTSEASVPSECEEDALCPGTEDHAQARDQLWRPSFDARALAEKQQLEGCWLLAAGFGTVGIASTSVAYALGWWAPFCTTRGGRGGHQLWPWLQPAPPHFVVAIAGEVGRFLHSSMLAAGLGQLVAWLELPSAEVVVRAAMDVGLAAAYLILVALPLHLYRGESSIGAKDVTVAGWLPQHVLMLLGPPLLVPLFWLYRFETGSIWCWQASVMMALALLEPWVLTLSASARELALGPRALVPILRESTKLLPPPPPEGSFEPSAAWTGPRAGFVFRRGPGGQGYYRDTGEYQLVAWDAEDAMRPPFGGWLIAWRQARRVRATRGLTWADDQHLAVRMRFLAKGGGSLSSLQL